MYEVIQNEQYLVMELRSIILDNKSVTTSNMSALRNVGIRTT